MAAETTLVHSCATCGMVLDDGGEFHPYMFCMLKQAGHDPWADFRWAAGQFGLDLPERPALVSELRRPMDEHDDLVESRLLERMERDGLLADGLTWVDARTALDG